MVHHNNSIYGLYDTDPMQQAWVHSFPKYTAFIFAHLDLAFLKSKALKGSSDGSRRGAPILDLYLAFWWVVGAGDKLTLIQISDTVEMGAK